MEQEKKYVDNEVFKFRLYLKNDLDCMEIPVYTKPRPEPADDEVIDEDAFWEEHRRYEQKVQDKYFTKEKIAAMKQVFIERIMAEENPFDICCVDYDGGYNVTEEQLFNMED